MVPRRQSPISFMHQQCFCAAGLEALSCSEQAADPCGAEKEVQLAASFLSLGWAKLKFHIQTSLGKRIWNWFPFPKDKCAWIHTVFELFSCVISVRIWNYSLVSELRNESIYEFPIVFWTSKEGGVGLFCFVFKKMWIFESICFSFLKLLKLKSSQVLLHREKHLNFALWGALILLIASVM